MYCENCGAKLENNAKFCQNCGEIVSLKDKKANGSLKIPVVFLGIFGGIVIMAGTIFSLMNDMDTKTVDSEINSPFSESKHVQETYNTLSESNYTNQDTKQEENGDTEIAPDNILKEDEDTVSASSEIVEDTSFERVYDLIGVLNQEDKQSLEEQYIQTSKEWQCNFGIFYVDSVTEQNEDDVYRVIQQYISTWENNVPSIIFIYDNSAGIVNTYSCNNSLDMMGEYTKGYIESETEGLIHCVPEDSLDFYNIGGLMINAYYELHEKVGSNCRFTVSDLAEIEIICKNSIAYSDYKLLLEGYTGLDFLDGQDIKRFRLIDMNGDGIEELVVDVTQEPMREQFWYYIFQWNENECATPMDIYCEVVPLLVKEDNTLVSYLVEDGIYYPSHYVLSESGFSVQYDEEILYFNEKIGDIPFKELEMISNTEDNRYNYLSTVLQR